MSKNRPINLDLMKFHFPPMAILSICHRISGVLLFILLPLPLYLLKEMLESASHFNRVQMLLEKGSLRFLIWVVACVTLFHLVAGIRHLIMDLGCGESLRAGKYSAYIVFIVSILLFILMGIWIW